MQVVTRVNKQGQALGRKGEETRRRLLDATLELIATEDSHKLNASRIARAAGLASQSFYLYFKEIDELLLALAVEASAEFTEVLQVLDNAPADIDPQLLSRRLVDAFGAYWSRHRAILNLRNYLADCGNVPFLKLRTETTMPLIYAIAARIRAAHPDGALSEPTSRGRAILAYQGLERTLARENALQYGHDTASLDLREAAVDLLTLLLTPAPTPAGA